jgi:hypothetical protein
MKEHPIIFTGPMVRALLEGRKTQTRRLLYGKSGRRVALATVKAGDHLYVREALAIGGEGPICYAADGAAVDCSAAPDFILTTGTMSGMFMPKWASRISLEVSTATTEPLHDISDDDARAEGVVHTKGRGGWIDYLDELKRPLCSTPKESYATLWASLHGADSWAANPQVIVLEFERIR